MNTLRILLADDHERFRAILSRFLSSQKGVEIVGEASDGIEAVEKTEKLRPNLVFMDLHMPSCDGIEATRTIKQHWPLVKVFMLSLDSTEYYPASLTMADGFLAKQEMKHDVLAVLSRECMFRISPKNDGAQDTGR